MRELLQAYKTRRRKSRPLNNVINSVNCKTNYSPLKLYTIEKQRSYFRSHNRNHQQQYHRQFSFFVSIEQRFFYIKMQHWISSILRLIHTIHIKRRVHLDNPHLLFLVTKISQRTHKESIQRSASCENNPVYNAWKKAAAHCCKGKQNKSREQSCFSNLKIGAHQSIVSYLLTTAAAAAAADAHTPPYM